MTDQAVLVKVGWSSIFRFNTSWWRSKALQEIENLQIRGCPDWNKDESLEFLAGESDACSVNTVELRRNRDYRLLRKVEHAIHSARHCLREDCDIRRDQWLFLPQCSCYHLGMRASYCLLWKHARSLDISRFRSQQILSRSAFNDRSRRTFGGLKLIKCSGDW